MPDRFDDIRADAACCAREYDTDKEKGSSLTDNWKAGKFKTGERFFISVNGDKPEPATVSMDGDFIDMSGAYISPYTNKIEVLAPCDYEELQRLKKKTILYQLLSLVMR